MTNNFHEFDGQVGEASLIETGSEEGKISLLIEEPLELSARQSSNRVNAIVNDSEVHKKLATVDVCGKANRLGWSGGIQRKRGKNFEEIMGSIELVEAIEGQPRRIRVSDVIVADVINVNQRRYPSGVIHSAITEVKLHLNESAGQGRAIQYLDKADARFSSAFHKGTRRPNFLEVVIKWDEISFDGHSVSLGGFILATNKGKDILAFMEDGIKPGIRLRGYGKAKSIIEQGQKLNEVVELHLTGFDIVLNPSLEMQKESQPSLEVVREYRSSLKNHASCAAARVE